MTYYSRGQLCLIRQQLLCTALCTGYAPYRIAYVNSAMEKCTFLRKMTQFWGRSITCIIRCVQTAVESVNELLLLQFCIKYLIFYLRHFWQGTVSPSFVCLLAE